MAKRGPAEIAMRRALANLRIAIRWQRRHGPEPAIHKDYGALYSGKYVAMCDAEAWLRAGLGQRSRFSRHLASAVANQTPRRP